MKKKTIIVVAAVMLIAVGVWYWGSPAYAMSQLRDAAVSGDKEDLEERIDFAAVRESLKSEMSAMMAAELAATPAPQGFEAMGSMLARGMVGFMVESMVTPEGMEAMIKQGRLQRAEAAAQEEPGEVSDGRSSARA